jgi:hypothetical protein
MNDIVEPFTTHLSKLSFRNGEAIEESAVGWQLIRCRQEADSSSLALLGMTCGAHGDVGTWLRWIDAPASTC